MNGSPPGVWESIEGLLLAQLGKHLQSKADQFQETDHQYHTILEHAMISTVSPTALFAASGMDSRAILPEYGNNSTVISNPARQPLPWV